MKFVEAISNSDRQALNKAITVAELSDCHFRHGAVIRKNGNTVAVGVNYNINDPAFLDNDVAAEHAAVHAEVAALNACKKMNLSGATLYVARINKNGEPRMSKPCARCQKAIRERGIKKVIYTIENVIDL